MVVGGDGGVVVEVVTLDTDTEREYQWVVSEAKFFFWKEVELEANYYKSIKNSTTNECKGTHLRKHGP